MSGALKIATVEAVSGLPPNPDVETQSAWLSVLGAFSLNNAEGREVPIKTKRNRVLLAFLALSPGRSATRERIATLLWGSRGEAEARSNLRQSLAVLRKELGTEVHLIQTEDEMVLLQPQALRVDALEILSCAELEDLSQLRQAAGYCRGELLADISLAEETFEEWLSSERSRLRAAEIRLFERLSQLEAGPSRIEAARALVQLDSLRESSHRLLMRAYAEQGDNGQALKQYEVCRTVLHDELQAEPAQETQELRLEIARGSFKASRENDKTSSGLATYPQLPDRPSIAVLPFNNMSSDPEQEYFADGVVEEIITSLSHVKWLFVIARTSSFIYKGRAVDVKQVSRELGVRYILEGSIRKAGGRVRITGQLIDALNGTHLWADRFESTLGEIFGLQDQVTGSVVAAIAPKLEQAEIDRARRKPTESLDAYDHYLRGLFGVHQWTREDSGKALREFYRAIDLDPDFAAAYGMAARCYSQRKMSGWMEDSTYEITEAGRLARRAANLGDDNAVALATASIALTFVVRDLDQGRELADRATAIDPNMAWAWLFSGWARVWVGEPETAREHFEHALRLNPQDPHRSNMFAGMALAHFFSGQNEEALKWAERSVRERSGVIVAAAVLAASAALAGNETRAREALDQLRLAASSPSIADLFKTYPPLRRSEDKARLAAGLRKAGLPE